jgi:hypothetical protein
MGPTPAGGLATYSQPAGVTSSLWVDPAHAPGSDSVATIVAPGSSFDSTRGFPGEGPTDLARTPWFLEDAGTRHLHDRKRRFSEPRSMAQGASRAEQSSPSAGRRLSFDPVQPEPGTGGASVKDKKERDLKRVLLPLDR